jgi:hypothetical protein
VQGSLPRSRRGSHRVGWRLGGMNAGQRKTRGSARDQGGMVALNRSSEALELQPSKLVVRVRFPSAAPLIGGRFPRSEPLSRLCGYSRCNPSFPLVSRSFAGRPRDRCGTAWVLAPSEAASRLRIAGPNPPLAAECRPCSYRPGSPGGPLFERMIPSGSVLLAGAARRCARTRVRWLPTLRRWCASQELRLHGGCRVRFRYGIPRRCGSLEPVSELVSMCVHRDVGSREAPPAAPGLSGTSPMSPGGQDRRPAFRPSGEVAPTTR